MIKDDSDTPPERPDEWKGEEPCRLPGCDNRRLKACHYCCGEHEDRAAGLGIRVTEEPSEVYDG